MKFHEIIRVWPDGVGKSDRFWLRSLYSSIQNIGTLKPDYTVILSMTFPNSNQELVRVMKNFSVYHIP
ncbi:hypothetical protein LC612_07185 [Nostoc sp. CHAB 5834]|nr:hypothetical protein [Nostoc sp. CHAB 5834]